MATAPVQSLLDVFAQVPDTRRSRGVRHPLPAILSLVFLGLLARIREMAVLQRWAEEHWDELREPLGFTRDERPHATTISRALAGCDLAAFTGAFTSWLERVAFDDQPLTVAIDGKTSCQGLDAHGDPVQMLTALVHDVKVVIGQWSVKGEKTNEPGVFKNHLPELCANFPLLRLITGDAMFAQRPLVEALLAENCDYLLQIKANQRDVQDALVHCLGDAHERVPLAQTIEKKGVLSTAVASGLI